MKALALVVALVLAVPGVPAAAQDGEALWRLIQGGGQVIMIRHAITTPGVGDPPGMTLEDCRTQRNLTDEGRAHASRVGEAFRVRAIPIARVLSSPWCRCLETARLAFGRADVWTPLSNLFGRSEARAAQVGELEPVLAQTRTGGNLVMVTHGSTIQAVTGINPATAEMVVVTPQRSGRFAVAGRLAFP